MLLICSHIYL
uniref:Uncharacterized protein n=1 Tax=Lepeophtheirus salmonis TaxID=72036 RepID=A0A0K2UYN7_LEPSM